MRMTIFHYHYLEISIQKVRWDLSINSNSTETLLTTLVIKDLNNSSTDSTFLLLTNEFGDTVMNVQVFDELVFSSKTQSFTLAFLQK